MEREQNTSGNIYSAIEYVEMAISEGISSVFGAIPNKSNIFGRPLICSNTENLGFSIGLSATGLRSAAVLSPTHLDSNINNIKSAGDQLLPIVIHLLRDTDRSVFDPYPKLRRTFQLAPGNIKEVRDFTIIAHKVAEMSLVPGIVLTDLAGGELLSQFKINQKELSFVGNSDDQIESPTPAQKIIFGKTRRRITNWFNPDLPLLTGSSRSILESSLSEVAFNNYIFAHIQEILAIAFSEFNQINDTQYDSIQCDHPECKYVIVSHGEISCDLSSYKSFLEKSKVGILDIKVLRPFPANQVAEFLGNKKGITVLDPIAGDSDLLEKVMLATTRKSNLPTICSGTTSGLITEDELTALVENMKKKHPKERFYLNIAFSRSKSNFPKQEVLLQQIQRQYPSLGDMSLGSIEQSKLESDSPTEQPLVIRQFENHGPPFTRQSGFIDHTGVFYEIGKPEEQVADPFKALGSIPAATASIRQSNASNLPDFKQENCTACGSCFVYCPHTAIHTAALGIEQMIQAAMENASKQGNQILALIPHVKNLAKITGQTIKNMDTVKDLKLGDLITPAFNKLVEQSKVDDEKRTQMEIEFQTIFSSFSQIPVAITDVLFHEPEKQQKDSGSLFSLTIDPYSCTGCRLCSSVCEEEALEMKNVDRSFVEKIQAELKVWELLPDTSTDVINRLLYDPSYNSFAALLMSRNFNLSIVGNSEGESDLATKQFSHLITGVAESIFQPKYHELVDEINDLQLQLSDNIHVSLSGALPKENFDEISKAISTETGKTSLVEIINKLGKDAFTKQLDTEDLRRKIELKESLKSFSWALQRGPSGIGRARYGTVLDKNDSFTWSERFPYNPFTSPATILWNLSTPEVSLGLIQGQIRHLIDNIKLLRRAALEVKNKYVPKEHDMRLSKLDWTQLEEKEKAIIPPILVFGDRRMLDNDRDDLLTLLSSGFPLKVFVLDDLAFSPGSSDQMNIAQSDMIALMAMKKAYLFQGGLSAPNEVFSRLVEGIQMPIPALYRLFAPNLEKHNIDKTSWPALSSLAIKSRTLPAFSFNPNNYRGSLNSSVDLSVNPSLKKDFLLESLQGEIKESDQPIEFAITFADWVYTLESWNTHFRKHDNEKDPEAIHIGEYLKESTPGGNFVPVIYRLKDGVLNKYVVSDQVVYATRTSKDLWDLLLEIGGERTQFPEKLRLQVEEEYRSLHQDEIEVIKKEYELKLRTSEKEQMKAIKKRLQEKLVELAARKISQE